MSDRLELIEQTVYVLNGLTLLPHYTLPCFVTPGLSNDTPMKLWTVRELEEKGAVKSSAFLWPRHTSAAGGWRG